MAESIATDEKGPSKGSIIRKVMGGVQVNMSGNNCVDLSKQSRTCLSTLLLNLPSLKVK